MAELKTFDFTGALGRGLQLGQAIRQQQNQGKLAALLGQARTTSGPQRDALMGQAYGLDPATGIAADQGFGQLDEAKIKRMGQMASIFTSVDPQQRAAMWPSIRQEMSQMIPGAQYPDMWDESLLPQAQAIAQQLSGAGSDAPAGFAAVDMAARAAGFQPGTPEYQKVMRIHTGFEPGYAKTSPRSITTDINGVPTTLNYDPTTGGYMPAVIGGAPQQQMGGGASYGGQQQGGAPAGDLLASVQSLVGPVGGRITSTTGGRHNNGSLHPGGGAVDVGMAQESPEEQERIIATLRSNPALRVVDERQRPPGQKEWSGPHVHVEWAQGPQQGGSPGAGQPIVGRTKEDEEAAKEAAKRSVGLQFAGPEAQAKAEETRLVEEAKRGAMAGAKRDEKRIEAQGKLRGILDRQAMVTEAIDDALNAPGFDAAFGIDAVRGFIPDTDARAARQRVETVRNQIRLNVLSDLKALSPTGGAVGQVSNEEGRIMAGYLGQLDFLSSDEEARRVMQKIKDRMASMAQRLQEAQEQDFRDPQQAPDEGGQFSGFRVLD